MWVADRPHGDASTLCGDCPGAGSLIEYGEPGFGYAIGYTKEM